MRATLLASGVGGAMLVAPLAHAQHFNAEFLKNVPGGQPVDLSYFEKNDGPLPGVYPYDVRLLERRRGTSALRFRDDGTPCLTLKMLDMVGVDLDKLEKNSVALSGNSAVAGKGTTERSASTECVALDHLIPGASYKVIAHENAIDFTIPGQWLKANISDDGADFDPHSFTEGATAGYVGYNFFGNENLPRGAPSSRNFTGLVNYGLAGGEALHGWNVQGSTNVQRQSGQKTRFQNGDVIASKDLVGLHSVVSVGDGSANSDFFGGYSFRGTRLATDLNMYPPSYEQVSPVISGVANTHAQITIYRDGRVVASRLVSPGPYVLDDILPGAGSGTYDVVQREATGQEIRWQIHFNSAIQLLHKGVWSYGATLGQLHHATNRQALFDVEASYGFSNRFTGSGGALVHPRYRGVGAGASADLGLAGALTTTFSYAQSHITGRSASTHAMDSGTSLGLVYGKNVGPLTASISGSHNFGRYRTLQDATSTWSSMTQIGNDNIDFVLDAHPFDFVDRALVKQQWNASLSAAVGHGYFNVTIDKTRYQNGGSSQIESISSSYSLPSVRGVSLGSLSVGFGRARLPGRKAEGQVMATWLVPLGKRMSGSVAFTHVPGGASNYSEQVNSGQLGPNGAFSYSLGAQQPSQGTSGWNGSVRYNAPYTTLQGTYYQQGLSKFAQMGATGAVVVHAGGVTATNQQLTSSFVVVQTNHVKDVGIVGQQNIRTDRFGYAIVPFATPYRVQQLDLDTRDLPAGVDVKNATYRVAGRNGAAVWAKYETYINRRALITLIAPDGKPVPFGAMAHDDEGNALGWVGQDGKLFATGLRQHNRITVVWPHASCWGEFTLPEKAPAVYDELSLDCKALESAEPHPASASVRKTDPAPMDASIQSVKETRRLSGAYGAMAPSSTKHAAAAKFGTAAARKSLAPRNHGQKPRPIPWINQAPAVRVTVTDRLKHKSKTARQPRRPAPLAAFITKPEGQSRQMASDHLSNAALFCQIYQRVPSPLMPRVSLILQIVGEYLYQKRPLCP